MRTRALHHDKRDDTRISQFTFDPSGDRFPIWSPDGRSIVFDSNRSKGCNLYISSSNAPGGERLLLETAQDKTIFDWSPDGRHLIFQSNDPTTGIDLWIYPFDGNQQPYPFLRTGSNERRAAFSPDGRWVAYLSNESGQYEVYVRPFFEPSMNSTSSASNTYVKISTVGGLQPRWNPNGKELHYMAPDGMMMSVPLTISGDSIEAGAPVALFEPQMFGVDDVDAGLQYDIAPDGRFLVNTISGDTSPISMIANWRPAARK